jgi:hypothetical protein
MSVISQKLGNGEQENWRLVFDVDAPRLFVEEQLSIESFLAQMSGTEAHNALVELFIDMFPNPPEDQGRAAGEDELKASLGQG